MAKVNVFGKPIVYDVGAINDGENIVPKILEEKDDLSQFTKKQLAKHVADGEGAVYELRGGIDRGATVLSTRLIGNVNKTVISEDSPPWDVLAEADNYTGALRLKVKGESGKTVRWVAHIRTVEVMN